MTRGLCSQGTTRDVTRDTATISEL